jgi:phosphoglycerate dehydrogenase-like enzyme/glyoxylase-like metal-dependent hydrolase (beta-lactamase superfamily II)
MLRRSIFISLIVSGVFPAQAQQPIPVTELAPGVFFLEMPNQPRFIGSNVGWVIFEDYVLVIDAGFAPGARVALDEIRRVTDKPVRFVLDTHHHADHALGNGVFVAEGATVVCHAECQRIEREIQSAARDESSADAAEKIAWKTGTLTFEDRLVFDDGNQRVEVLHFGHAHTAGDSVAWLPKHRVLFTGDACVNGAFFNLADSDTASWLRVLDRCAALGPTAIAPGHGKAGDASLLALNTRWLTELRGAVQAGIARGFGRDEIQKSLDLPWFQEWTGVAANARKRDLDHVFAEATGILPPTDLLANLGIVPDGQPLSAQATWTKPTRILIAATIPLPAMKHVVSGVELVPVSSPADAMSKIGDADALIGFCTNDLLEKGTKLRWVQVGSAGVERYVSHEAIASGRVLLTNAQRIHGPPIAEHVFAMTFALTRGIKPMLAAQADGIWNANVIRDGNVTELAGKTLLVVGLGGIGSEVARIGHGLGMRVIATKRSPGAPPPGIEKVGGAGELATFAAEADLVVNCMPLTAETTRVFDAKVFGAMKRGALFVNIGRGKSVVTGDLVAALKEGRLGGAALDVTDPEPLPGGHELWSLDNVIISPHVSANTDRSDERMLMVFRENLRRFVAGEAMLNVVDPQAGY